MVKSSSLHSNAKTQVIQLAKDSPCHQCQEGNPTSKMTIHVPVCQILLTFSESYYAENSQHGVKSTPKAREPWKVARRLAYFINIWKVSIRDTWVLNTIEGHVIPLKGNFFSIKDRRDVLQRTSSSLLREEINLKESTEFFSQSFFSPQKEW